MVEHTLQTVLDLLIQGYYATADCVTANCARLQMRDTIVHQERKRILPTMPITLSMQLISHNCTDINALVSLSAITCTGMVLLCHPRVRAHEPIPLCDV